MTELAVQLHSHHLPHLSQLWNLEGIRAIWQEDFVWCRAAQPTRDVQKVLSWLPSLGRYEVLPDELIRVPGSRIPCGRLPQGSWLPLERFLTLTLPPSAIPALNVSRVAISLTPAADFTAPNVLITEIDILYHYTQTAPNIRLNRCRFAAAAADRVLIHGTPLPPIPGTYFVERCGIVVPAGYHWTPAIEPALLARIWHVPTGDLWMLTSAGSVMRIASENLIQLSRASVADTREALHVER